MRRVPQGWVQIITPTKFLLVHNVEMKNLSVGIVNILHRIVFRIF